jgi:hypothetical protein
MSMIAATEKACLECINFIETIQCLLQESGLIPTSKADLVMTNFFKKVSFSHSQLLIANCDYLMFSKFTAWRFC